MSNVTALLAQRLKKNTTSSKMTEMARQSTNGSLNSFSSIFSVAELSNDEKEKLSGLLHDYALEFEEYDYERDLTELAALTMELKAITNQAAILHGERIKKAQQILTRYQDGAFTAWLMATYGNRQTPYNFLLYYEFYHALPGDLRHRLEEMPRQAIYTLASREGEFSKKKQIVIEYNGETKNELLSLIRLQFPLAVQDKRRGNGGDAAIKLMRQAYSQLNIRSVSLSRKQKQTLKQLLQDIQELVSQAAVEY